MLALVVSVHAASPVATSFSTAVPITAQSAIQLLGSDPDGTPLTFATTTSPSHGTLTNLDASTGIVIYTPATGYTGADSFNFTVTSGGETSSAATVTITVTSAKTRIIDTLTNPDGSPRQGIVTFQLTQISESPAGLIPAKASVSATLSPSGQFDISVYPSRAVSPVQYYQVYIKDTNGNQQPLGLYDIPAATTAISLSGHRVFDNNLGAQYAFASQAAMERNTLAVANATFQMLLGSSPSDGQLLKFDAATGKLVPVQITESDTQISVNRVMKVINDSADPFFICSSARCYGAHTYGNNLTSNPYSYVIKSPNSSTDIVVQAGSATPTVFFPTSEVSVANSVKLPNVLLNVQGGIRGTDLKIGSALSGPVIALAGDSRTYGQGIPHPPGYYVTWPTWNGLTFIIQNTAIPGHQLNQWIGDEQLYLLPYLNYNAGLNIVVYMGVSNDWHDGGRSVAQTELDTQLFCSHLQSLNVKCIVTTEISRTGLDANKNAYNDWLRKHWRDIGAVKLVDLGANSHLGCDGCYADPNYFYDGTHETTLGAQVWGGILQTAIEEYINGTKPTCSLTERGTIYRTEGGAGQADKVEQCLKKSDDTYAWVQVVSAP